MMIHTSARSCNSFSYHVHTVCKGDSKIECVSGPDWTSNMKGGLHQVKPPRI
jgi:hypothetical protein